MRNRTWVKYAAIVFFAVMALLTFFSGTIRNLTLPQVTTKPVTSGTITPVIAGGGMTEAGPAAEITAKRRGIVKERLAAAGERVKAGDGLLLVEYRDDGSLTAMKSQLEQQETAYAEAQLSASVSSDSGAWAEYQILKNNLEEARQRQTRCQEYAGKRRSLDSQLASAESVLAAAEDAFHANTDGAAEASEQAYEALTAAQRQQENARANYTYYAAQDPESAETAAAKTALEEADAAVLICQNRCYAADSALQALLAEYQPQLDAARQKADSLERQIASLEMEYAGCTDETACENAVLSAKSALSSYYDRQKNAAVQDELTAARLAAMEAQIEALKQEISELEAQLGEKTVCAEADGVLETVFEKEQFEAGEVLITLRSTEAYTLRCSVSLAEAALLQIGAEARITNQSGGGSRVTLIAVGPDPADPTNRKELTFSVVGENAAPGQYLTLAIALESSRHDLVVPNAAVYQDSIGFFVYIAETKTTPLGSRSKVRRVDVEEVRRDDGYTAVKGELTSRDYVVILSSAPLSDGQAVRFGD